MTLANIKPFTTTTKTQTKGIESMTTFNPAYTIEQILVECEISKKALILIDKMKVVLSSEELRAEFMSRIPFEPSGYQINKLIDQMRKEQLKLNPLSSESFLDMYLLNPLDALRAYFKHSISLGHLERMKEWGINIKDIVEIKNKDNEIYFDNAMMEIYCR